MSIIKCPECRGQVSTMAGTCPHCGTSIAGKLRQCHKCNSYCLTSQDKCPECGAELEEEVEQTPSPIPQEETEVKPTTKKKKSRKTSLWKWIIMLLLFALACAGTYLYNNWRTEQREQADYARLANVTNPEFYQQFLIDYPKSKHYDEIHERMLVLQAEASEWQQLLQGITRANVARFMQKHPNSLRQRACEDMLDSIDWQEALAIGNEEAITDYLQRHPSGRFVTDAAEKKNILLLTKVTSGERALIRGTLEAFFSKVIAGQDIEVARAAIPDTMQSFCGRQDADAEAIIEYAKEKMAQDVIGLHYTVGQKMDVRKETLPDGNMGFAVEVGVEETISRSDVAQPTSNNYRVSALLNQEQKIVRMNITK